MSHFSVANSFLDALLQLVTMLHVLNLFSGSLRYAWIRGLTLMRDGRFGVPDVTIDISRMTLRLAMLKLLLLECLLD